MPEEMDRRVTDAARLHEHCWACGQENDPGLRLEFTAAADGTVTAVFGCDGVYAGYPGQVQGGVVAAVLDSAMTNCLFSLGYAGVTADMRVRFRRAVVVDRPATVTARLVRTRRLTRELEAELVQDGQVIARAEGVFMRYPGGPSAPV